MENHFHITLNVACQLGTDTQTTEGKGSNLEALFEGLGPLLGMLGNFGIKPEPEGDSLGIVPTSEKTNNQIKEPIKAKFRIGDWVATEDDGIFEIDEIIIFGTGEISYLVTKVATGSKLQINEDDNLVLTEEQKPKPNFKIGDKVLTPKGPGEILAIVHYRDEFEYRVAHKNGNSQFPIQELSVA